MAIVPPFPCLLSLQLITMHKDTSDVIFLEGLVRYQDLIALSGGAKPCGQLHGRAEEIIAVLDRLTTIQPDTDVNGLPFGAVVTMELALDINGAIHGKPGAARFDFGVRDEFE
ncbi:hypothetical protein J2735_004726 [Agrobacterium tumefaciens]|nr:hypothetical protein [Agrobacterium tumefaciens]